MKVKIPRVMCTQHSENVSLLFPESPEMAGKDEAYYAFSHLGGLLG